MVFTYMSQQFRQALMCQLLIKAPPRAQQLRQEVPIYHKELLSLSEAAAYTGLGINKLRALSNNEDCGFVLWNSSKRMLKRRQLEAYLEEAYSI